MTVVGEAWVKIRADGTGLPAEIRSQIKPGMAAAEAESSAGGTRAGKAYEAGWKAPAAGAATAVESSGGRIRKDLEKSSSETDRFRVFSKNNMKGVGESFSTGASGVNSFRDLTVLGFAAAGVAAVRMAGNFEESTTQLVTGAGESTKNLDMVRKGLLAMAGQVGVSASDLSKGMYQIESAGFHGAAGLNILRIAAEGAKVGNADMATVADVLTSALNAYHLPASQATSVTNDLIATVARGKTHMQDLASSLGEIMPIAAQLHIPLSQVTGAMATMTVQGTSAGKAATSLRYLLSALVNPTSKASSTMQDFGLSTTKVGNTLTHQGLQAALTQITDAVGKKFPAGSAQYTAAVAKMVGGTRGMTATLELSGTHAAVWAKNTQAIGKAAGDTSGKVHGWALVQKDFNTQLDIAKSTAGAVAIQLGTHLLPVFTHIVQDGSKAATWFGHTLAPAIGSVLGEVNKLAGGQLPHIAEGFLAIAAAVTIGRFTGLFKLIGVMAGGVSTAAKFGGSLITLARGGATAAETFPRVAKVVSGVGTAVSGIGTAVTGARLGLLKLGAFFGVGELAAAGLTGGVLAAAGAFAFLMYRVVTAKDPVTTFAASVIKTNEAVGNNVAGYRKAAAALSTYINGSQRAGEANVHARFALQAYNIAAAEGNKVLSGLNKSQRNVLTGAANTVQMFATRLGPQFKITNEQAAALATRLGINLSRGWNTVQKSGLSARQAMNNYVTSVELSHNPQQRLALDLQTIHDKAQSATAQANAFTDALQTMSGKTLGAQQAANTFQQQIASLASQVSAGTKTLRGNSGAAVQNRGAILNAVNAAEQHAQAVFNQTGNLRKSRDALIADEKSLISNADAVGINHGQLIKMLESLGATPAQAAKALGAMQSFARNSGISLKKLADGTYNVTVKGHGTFSIDPVATRAQFSRGTGPGQAFGGATGGMIPGSSPSPTADNIPLWGTAGEFMHPVDAVQHYGLPAMEAVRTKKAVILPRYGAGGPIPGYALGGPIGPFASASWKPPGLVSQLEKYVTQGENAVATSLGRELQELAQLGNGASNVLAYAKRYLGVPYVWGGAEPNGFDCSGFTSFVLHHFNIPAPRTAAAQQAWARGEAKDAALPGDLVFYGDPAHHVGFYLGGNQYLDAPHTGSVVSIQPLYDSPTFGKEPGIQRFQDVGAIPTGGGSASANRALGMRIAAQRSEPFPPLDYIFSHESGWNNRAQSPTSTAYGIAQFEDMTWPAYGGKTSDPGRQIVDGIQYMIDRYGGPDQAEAYWKIHHNYDSGGWLQPGLTRAVNATGKREAVMPEDIMVDAINRAQNPAALLRAVDELTDYAAQIRDLVAQLPGGGSYQGVTSG